MESVNILLVDDEPRNLDALEAVLAGQGYNLMRAEDADRALRLLLDSDDVAVILLDIQMPNVNGIELAQIIKATKRFRQIPILFLTAHMVDDQDVISGYDAGAVDYLTKPFNTQVLKHKVAVFAELFRKTRALADLNETLEDRVQQRTAELEKSEAALRAAARQKDEFLAVLAHELRNPLAPVRTGLSLLERQLQGPQSPVVGRTLAAMNRQLEHMVRLIDDLLDVSRINGGVLELKKERADLAALVGSAVETFRGLFEQKRILVSVTTPRGIEGVVDATRVAQIIGNLLHNASKYTPPNGTVNVAMTYENGQALIRVTDNGMGIPADQLQRVFEMFTRIDRKAPNTDGGAGLGLALAKRLAQMHGGDLTASSDGEGQGTTFTLSLPAEQVAQETGNGVAPMQAAAHIDTRALDILVIEDNDDVADTLAAWLESEGHRVKIARTGPAGLDMALTTRPEVVLCDLGLPGIDGIEVCQQVRARGREFRPLMIALTGWGKDEDRKRTRDAGFDHHLVKPVPLDKLTTLLESVKP